jgi:hypothetical protein
MGAWAEVNCNERRLIGKEIMKAAGESWWHQQMRDDIGGNKALPRTSNISCDKRCNDGGREVARQYGAEKKWL